MQSKALCSPLGLSDPGLFRLHNKNGCARSASLSARSSPVLQAIWGQGVVTAALRQAPFRRTSCQALQLGPRRLAFFTVPINAQPRKRCRREENGGIRGIFGPPVKRSRAAIARAAQGQGPAEIEEVLLQVKLNDTLSELSETFQCTVEQWVAENPELEDEHHIYEGKYLRIPKAGWSGKTPRAYRGRIKIHRFPADARNATADEQARVSMEVADVPTDEDAAQGELFVSSAGIAPPPPDSPPRTVGPWSGRGFQVLLLGILLVVGGLVGLLRRGAGKAKKGRAGLEQPGPRSGGKEELKGTALARAYSDWVQVPEPALVAGGVFAPKVREEEYFGQSLRISVREAENGSFPFSSTVAQDDPGMTALPVGSAFPPKGHAESLPAEQNETIVKADAGVPKNDEIDSARDTELEYPVAAREATAIANATSALPQPRSSSDASSPPPPPLPSPALSPAIAASDDELAPSSTTPFFTGALDRIKGGWRDGEAKDAAAEETNGSATSATEALSPVGGPPPGLAASEGEATSTLTSAATEAAESSPVATVPTAAAALEETETGLATVEGAGESEVDPKKVASRGALRRAVSAALPAVAVVAGAAATPAFGYEGGFQMVGLTALATFAASDLLLASKRKALWREVSSIRNHKQLMKVLVERNILPK